MARIGWALAAFFASTAAFAQPGPRVTRTSDYVERAVGGDQVVTFTGDELAAAPGGPLGDRILAMPGTVRVGLIRPRLNFVTELLKSVENL
jgi:hypothetical protein